MSELKIKSESSFDAAALLHENEYYSSSIHCSYYSCYQYMLYIWLDVKSRSNDDLKKISRESKQGSHEILINQIPNFLGMPEGKEFRSKIAQLKKLRVRADYSKDQIGDKESRNSINFSSEINTALGKIKK